MPVKGKRFAISFLLLFAMCSTAIAGPKRILILSSFGRDFSPWAEIARSFRAELEQKSSEQLEFHEASLATERFGAGQDEGPFVEYLKAMFDKHPLDLVVAIGAPAARFIQQHRQNVFPSTPMLLGGIEQRTVPLSTLGPNDTMAAGSIDHAAVFQNILRVLPETRNIAVVVGNSPIERFWSEQIRLAFQPHTSQVAVTFFDDLSFEEILKRAAALPPNSAIFFHVLSVDAAGGSHEGDKAFSSIRAVANAPIFSYIDTEFGNGIVGGPLLAMNDLAHQAVNVAMRILNGEAPGDIVTPPVRYGIPKFDWRELQRWNISESRLPPGSEIYFRRPGMWEQYHMQMTGGLAILFFQTAMISWLLLERRGRLLAEVETADRRREVVHLNRTATTAVMSASLAHELNQPLGAILSNTEAAEMLLKANPPDLKQIGEILSDIRRDDQRAGEIIHQLRNFLKNRNVVELQEFDLNDAVRDVVRISAPEAAKRGVKLSTAPTPVALPVRTDKVQLQQVMLNLVMNGMDAVETCEPSKRTLTIRTSKSQQSEAEVTVVDSGEGIPNGNLSSVFDPFFTTKPQGTGLGLPIARMMIESYGGKIWAENNADGGAIFCFTLPLSQSSPA